MAQGEFCQAEVRSCVRFCSKPSTLDCVQLNDDDDYSLGGRGMAQWIAFSLHTQWHRA